MLWPLAGTPLPLPVWCLFTSQGSAQEAFEDPTSGSGPILWVPAATGTALSVYIPLGVPFCLHGCHPFSPGSLKGAGAKSIWCTVALPPKSIWVTFGPWETSGEKQTDGQAGRQAGRQSDKKPREGHAVINQGDLTQGSLCLESDNALEMAEWTAQLETEPAL